MEVPDLSKLSSAQREEVEKLAELHKDQQEAVPPPKGHQALTAFLVIINHDGQAWAQPDCNFDLVLERQPNTAELYGACAQVQKNVMAAETAARVMNAMDQRAHAMIKAQREQAEAQRQAAEAEQIRASLGNLRTGGR
jgi:hypothetical protein